MQQKKFASDGKFDQALAKIDEAKNTIWQASPFVINYATIVSAEPGGFGMYDIRRNNEFKGDEKLVIYFEPSGYTYGRDGDLFVIDLGFDFVLKDSSGTSLGGQLDFSKSLIRSHAPNKETMARLN